MIAWFREFWIKQLGSKEDQAALWVAKHERDLTISEKRAFQRWITKHPSNEKLFEEHQFFWQGLDFPEEGSVESINTEKDDATYRFTNARYVGFGIAAAAVVVFTISMLLFHDNRPEEVFRLAIDTSGYKRQVLPDNSVIELKPGTQLNVSYTDELRHVYLSKGEAFFDVEHDPSRPFRVESRFADVMVVGTEFTVKQADKLMEVWVVQGKVKVSSSNEQNPQVPENQTYKEIIAGQKIIQEVDDGTYNTTIVEVTEKEIAIQLEWKDEILDFVSAPLYEIVAEFNRFNDTKIIIVDDELKTRRLSIAMKPQNFEDFIKLLSIILDAKVEYTNNLILVSSREKELQNPFN